MPQYGNKHTKTSHEIVGLQKSAAETPVPHQDATLATAQIRSDASVTIDVWVSIGLESSLESHFEVVQS